jgi:CheY-like chemotaxis protein
VSAQVDTPLRLLLVDDEDAIQRMFSRYLTRRGHRVEVASDGREALGAIDALDEGEAYDVILTDLRMPGMSGDALYARLLKSMMTN